MPRPRRHGELHPIGQRRTAQISAERNGRPGFRMPNQQRWRRELDFRGLRAVEDGLLPRARRLLGWARSRPGRADGRATRRMVACALLLQHSRYPGERTIAAGHEHLAELIERRWGVRLSRQTVCRVVQEMMDDAVLYRVQRGCSAAITGGRNLVAVYVVVEPDELDDAGEQALVELAARLDGHLPVGVVTGVTEEVSTARSTGEFSINQRRSRPDLYPPRNAAERAEAVAWLIGVNGWPDTERLRDELRKLAYPYLAAGWSARDLGAAIARPPDGEPHRGPLPGIRQRDRYGPLRIRNLLAVLTWRLRLWLAVHDGRWADAAPLDPPLEAVAPRPGRPPRPATLPAVGPPTAPGAAALSYLAAAGLRAGALR